MNNYKNVHIGLSRIKSSPTKSYSNKYLDQVGYKQNRAYMVSAEHK